MNTNKVIFGILGALIVGGLLLLAASLNSPKNATTVQQVSGDMTIWILDDDAGDFSSIVSSFKESYPSYNSRNIIVESFDDSLSYKGALTAAITLGKGPDIFVQNNSETSAFENQILGIDPTVISPNDFRQRFAPVFAEDLIISDIDDPNIEFLKGVPAGYETLGIFYNKKYFRLSSEIATWSALLESVQLVSEKFATIIPLALGNGSGITRAPEIITSLLVLEGSDSLAIAERNMTRQVLDMYAGFGDRQGDNRYNILSAPFENDKDIEYFAQGDVAAMFGYPRDLLEIDRIGYQRSFLFAAPFPSYIGTEKKVSIDYNYFVINKDTPRQEMAQDFLAFLSSGEGQQAYHETYPYYLAPEISLASQNLEKKILNGYNVVYKNFVSGDEQLISYDVGNRDVYHSRLVPILDLDTGYDSEFLSLTQFITCISTKQNTLLNLSSPCK